MTPLRFYLTWATNWHPMLDMSPIEFAFTGALLAMLTFAMTVVVFS